MDAQLSKGRGIKHAQKLNLRILYSIFLDVTHRVALTPPGWRGEAYKQRDVTARNNFMINLKRGNTQCWSWLNKVGHRTENQVNFAMAGSYINTSEP